MKYLSVCSGIEAASVAWHPLGWEPLAFSEIEPFPRAVLEHHYPDVPCHGDFTVLRNEPWIVDADVLVGGTPCQAFSVAGLRKSLGDDRGNLSLEFIKLADSIDAAREAHRRDPSVIVWENVPGVLSVKDNAFGCFLAGLAGDVDPYDPPRGKWTNAGVVDGPARTVAWRVLDAQYFGLAQRRRRVFVVASARDGFDPATVLLEFEGVRRDTAPRREAGQVAPTIPSRSTAGGGLGTDLNCDGGVITHSLRAEGLDASEDGTDRGTPLVPVAFAQNTRDEVRLQGGDGQIVGALAAEPGMKQTTYVATVTAIREDVTPKWQDDLAFTLTQPSPSGGGHPQSVAVAFGGDVARTLAARHDSSPCVDRGMDVVATSMAVRRLTPVECERLQGFPDGYTNIPWRKKPEAPDGPRYKALGNSMAVPVMRWIGRRIAEALRHA